MLSGHHRWGGGGDKHTAEKFLVKEQHAEIQEVPAEAVPNAFTCGGGGIKHWLIRLTIINILELIFLCNINELR